MLLRKKTHRELETQARAIIMKWDQSKSIATQFIDYIRRNSRKNLPSSKSVGRKINSLTQPNQAILSAADFTYPGDFAAGSMISPAILTSFSVIIYDGEEKGNYVSSSYEPGRV